MPPSVKDRRIKKCVTELSEISNQNLNKETIFLSRQYIVIFALGGLVVSVLATGPKDRGVKPGRGRWILRVIKSAARLLSEWK
jgi:hypothetical protein